ncbi:MAG: PilW family protein [Mahellales bacterium]|jgi:type II secretory pathway component PulJ
MKGLIEGKTGLTLLEVIFASALIATILTVGYSIYVMGLKTFNRDAAAIDMQQNIRIASSYINKKLLNAAEDSVQVSTNRLAIGKEMFQLSGTSLQVDHNHNPGHSNFNPLAEGIKDFRVNKEGRLITVVITGEDTRSGQEFSTTLEVFLRK